MEPEAGALANVKKGRGRPRGSFKVKGKKPQGCFNGSQFKNMMAEAGASANFKKPRGRPLGSFKNKVASLSDSEDSSPEFKLPVKFTEPVEKRQLPSRKAKETIVEPFQLDATIRSYREDRRKHPPQQSLANTVSLPEEPDNDTQPFWDKPLLTPRRPSGNSADWDAFLKNGRNLTFVAPVTCFKYAPLADIWESIAVTGLVVEVINVRVWRPNAKPIAWYATIRHYAGYKALIQYENLGIELSKKDAILAYAWMSFCSNVPKPLGYSQINRILMLPMDAVCNELPYPECKKMALQKYIDMGVPTVRENHGEFIRTEIGKCQKYKLGDMLEVMDRDNISHMRLARVSSLVGDRIHVSYISEEDEKDPGYWFSCHSSYVHELGFSETVGVRMSGAPNDAFKSLSSEYFPKYPPELKLVRGQMLEVRHPQLPHLIVGGRVFSVLKYGYFVAQIVSNKEERDFPVRFLFHVTSPYIFPCGFCENHGIELLPPYDRHWEGEFNWNAYFFIHKTSPAPLHLIPKLPEHNFKPGMKMEAICIVMPTFLGPATVRRVCGHLLELSFDGWPKNSLSPHEIWTSAFSPNIFPLGYAEMVSHVFKGRVEDPSVMSTNISKSRKCN